MLIQTKGIILKTTKYNDNSIIVKIYTKDFGLKSFIIHGLNSKNKHLRPILFQPLSIITLNAYNKPNQTIQNIKNIQLNYFPETLYNNISKSSVLIFMNDLLNQSITEEKPDKHLFLFIEQSILTLDKKQEINHFHLLFMVYLAKYLGFLPDKPSNSAMLPVFFDSMNGLFLNSPPQHPYYFSIENTKTLIAILNDENFSISKHSKQEFIKDMIVFYKLHLANPYFKLESINILSEIFI